MRGPYRKRRIHLPPHFKNFKPGGVPKNLLKSLTLTVDEYEAMRLADYEGHEHLQASEKMGISRPTFTRLIEKARNKIAKAIVEGMELVVEGGNIEFQNTLHRCRDCGDEQMSPSREKLEDCPECGSDNIEDIAGNYLDEKYSVKRKDIKGAGMNDLKKGEYSQGRRGQGGSGGRGRNRGGAFGPGGFCICAKCGAKTAHRQGVKCTDLKCPQCGHTMVREELLNKG